MQKSALQKGIGILYILGAALMFACMNLFVNLAGDLPLMQKVLFRNCITVAVVFVMLLFQKEKFRIHDKSCILWLLLRAAIGFAGVILNFYAIDHIGSISDASILNKLSPFFAIFFSIFLVREKPTVPEILFVLLAFGGAMFVVKPTFTVEALPAVSGFFSGVCAGFAYTCVRILSKKGERSNMIIFIFSALSTVVSLPFVIIWWKPMTLLQLLYLLLAGVAATGGQFFITAAYRRAPAKEIAVFDYAQVLFAAVLGFFFLNQIPDIWSFIGYAIIIGAAIGNAVYRIEKEKRAKKKQEEQAEETEKPPDLPPPDEKSGDESG